MAQPNDPFYNSVFEAGQQSVTYRIEDLERRERAVAEEEAYLKELTVALGVARYYLERDHHRRVTRLTVEWADVDMRHERTAAELINAVKSQIEAQL